VHVVLLFVSHNIWELTIGTGCQVPAGVPAAECTQWGDDTLALDARCRLGCRLLSAHSRGMTRRCLQRNCHVVLPALLPPMLPPVLQHSG